MLTTIHNPQSTIMSSIIPIARCAVTVRPAVAGDYAFIDRLQAMHGKALGFMRKAALEGKIAAGEVLVAWAASPCSSEEENNTGWQPVPLGYCIFSNRYLKRDELGVVYQMNVVPGAQRKLVAATLLKEVFERAPYGCKLCCCWCAQDLDANYFWEAAGFIPLAFRTGAVGKKTRTHIFWQRRIREGDLQTPYWYPSKTDGGMMREDRLVLPIPPGVHWKDPMPILIPEVQNALPAPTEKEPSTLKPIVVKPRRPMFGSPDAEPMPGPVATKPKPEQPKREKVKADPKHVAAARELRDRYLEHLNGEQFNSGRVIGEAPRGKYAVGRSLAQSVACDARRQLPQAA
jgi:hypothetical protein